MKLEFDLLNETLVILVMFLNVPKRYNRDGM